MALSYPLRRRPLARTSLRNRGETRFGVFCSRLSRWLPRRVRTRSIGISHGLNRRIRWRHASIAMSMDGRLFIALKLAGRSHHAPCGSRGPLRRFPTRRVGVLAERCGRLSPRRSGSRHLGPWRGWRTGCHGGTFSKRCRSRICPMRGMWSTESWCRGGSRSSRRSGSPRYV